MLNIYVGKHINIDINILISLLPIIIKDKEHLYNAEQ